MLNTPLQMMLVALAGWVNEQQLAVIEYLKEERTACSASRSAGDGCGSLMTSEDGLLRRGRRSCAGSFASSGRS